MSAVSRSQWMKYTDKGAKPSLGELFDHLKGKQLRDKGIERVSEHNDDWMNRCIKAASIYVRGNHYDFTGEDIRFVCREVCGEPKHPNAWGALTKSLVRRKIIQPTGEYRTPRDRSSHARMIQVYRKHL